MYSPPEEPAFLPPRPPEFTPAWEPPIPFNEEEELEEQEHWPKEQPVPV